MYTVTHIKKQIDVIDMNIQQQCISRNYRKKYCLTFNIKC